MRKRVLSVFVAVCMVASVILTVPMTVSAATGADIVNFAKSVSGAYYNPSKGESRLGPNTFDCSGFVYYVCSNVGISMSNGNTESQRSYGTDVDHLAVRSSNNYSNLQAGDLIFMDWSGGQVSGHVGIYIGSGKMIHCWSDAGTPIATSNLSDWGTSTGKIYSYICDVRRVASTTSNLAPSKPELIDVYPYYRVSKPITFTWNATQNTTHYNLYIDKLNDGSYERFESIHYASSGLTRTLPEGKYRVFLQSTNSNVDSTWVYTNSNYVYVTVFDKIENPVLKGMRQSYKTDAEVAFSWEPTENVTHYNLYIDKFVNGEYERLESIHYAESGQTYIFEKGEYRMFLQASNSYCRTDDAKNWLFSNSEYYYFNTFEAIETPVLNDIKSIYELNEEIEFHWNPTENTTHYNLYIDKFVDGEYERLENIHYVESGLTRLLSEGKYRVFLQSTNSNYRTEDGTNWLFSNSVYNYFIVQEGQPYITANVTKLSSNYTIEVSLYNIITNCDIVVSGYKDGNFVTCKSEPYSQGNVSFTLEGDIDEIRVMVWEGMSTLKPLCAAEAISESEWVTA